MKSIRLVLAFLALTIVPSFAGTPFKTDMVCPVGGEEFEITETASCSFMGRTMSFRQITSCDFVTRLPICPSNGLPIYQEFTQSQLSRLTKFITTPKFAEIAKLPPWQSAYRVSEFLGESGTQTAFWLLMNSMWYEWDEFLQNDTFVDELLEEAQYELERATSADRPFLQAILAYMLSASGRFEDANEFLDAARTSQETTEFLHTYIRTIQACQSEMEAEHCLPGAPIPTETYQKSQ